MKEKRYRKIQNWDKIDSMNDSSYQTKEGTKLRFSREQSFFDKSLGIRLIIGMIFTLSLFVILHFREVRVEVLELHSKADRYVVAQTDFDFYDEEATFILRQEAVRDISKIFLISDKEIGQRRADFENFLVTDETWREQLKESDFDDMYQAVDALEKTMLDLRFTNHRTLLKIGELDLSTEYYFTFSPINLEEPVLFPMSIWNAIGQLAFPVDQFNAETVQFVLNKFQVQPWTLSEDIPLERSVQRRIEAQVPDKLTHISAGKRIIDQGERVTTRHITILQAMKNALNEQRNLWHVETIAGSMVLAVLLTGICYTFFRVNFPAIIASNRKSFLIVTVFMITLSVAKGTEYFFLTSKGNLIEVVRYPLFVPFSAILLCCLLNQAVATFSCAFLTIILTMSLAFDRQGFMIMNLAAALVSILSARTLRQRKEIFIICGKGWLCCIGVIISLHLYQSTNGDGLLTDVLSAGGFMLLTAVLVVGLLPLMESGFHIMTDVTLMEYMDPNHELLRRLSIEAPGTYQHSVVVGNLAEAAALTIGANGLFCRVATLYHDVGKMVTPQYFTENQNGGMNIHQLLTPKESAQVIVAHVSEGVSMARKAGLPEQFIDIIKEHHGTTLAYYFYRKELERVGGDKSKMEEKNFRYFGPTPRSKESTIIMIADSMEAASRSLDEITYESLMDLTSRVVKDKAMEGQFDQSLLTFEEMAIVKETLAKTLVAFGHARVKYPKRGRGEETLQSDV